MSAPQPQLDIRRLFRRFILLVVLPTVGLVGFGVVAISNERAAVEQRFKGEYDIRLQTLAAHLVATLESAAERLRAGGPTGFDALVRFDFVLRDGRLNSTPAIDPATENALAIDLHSFAAPADGSVGLLPVRSGPARGLYAVRLADGGSLRGLAFSEEGLSASVAAEARRRFPAEVAVFAVQGPHESETPAPPTLRSLLDAAAEAASSARGAAGVLDLPLPAPLVGWRIVATLPGNDPIRTALVRNRTIYIVTLALFYVVIAIGVVVTLRGISREVALSRMKTDFVSNISHELRTPLTSIRMFAETLRMGRATTPEEQAVCIDFIARESERLSLIAERTLDWARLEAGRRPFVRERAEPSALIHDAVERFLSQGTLDRESVGLMIAEGLPVVDVDTGAIGQVLLNLLENAVKYSGPNKRIIVRARRARRGVLLQVEDNGVGIARRDINRVFDRFYRADDLLARRTEGSGLGLSIARRIVLAHGGRLTVKSVPGQGSIFTILLPVAGRDMTASA